MPDSETAATPKVMYWTGWVVSGLVVAGLIFSGVLKLVKPTDVTVEFTRLGWPDVALGLGIVEIACAMIYAIPRTAVLGAILVTGYLGGAIATHVRIDDNFIPPAVMGVLAWLGLYLRDARLRALLPLRM
jgi:DoxX-like protein